MRVIRNSGLTREDEEGNLVAYGFIEIEVDRERNEVLRIYDDENGEFRVSLGVDPAFDRRFKEASERMDRDPFLFAGDVDDPHLNALVSAAEKYMVLERRLRELEEKIEGVRTVAEDILSDLYYTAGSLIHQKYKHGNEW